MVKGKNKGLRDVGLDNAFNDQDEEEDEDVYKSKFKPENFEYDAKPTVDRAKYWTSIEEAKKAFEEHGFSLGAINAEKSISAEKRIHANTGAERFFAKVDLTQEPITQIVDTMIRQRNYEFYKDEKGREKRRVKEFLTYNVELQGKDWLRPYCFHHK